MSVCRGVRYYDGPVFASWLELCFNGCIFWRWRYPLLLFDLETNLLKPIETTQNMLDMVCVTSRIYIYIYIYSRCESEAAADGSAEPNGLCMLLTDSLLVNKRSTFGTCFKLSHL